MNAVVVPKPLSRARWDGTMVLFDLVTDDDEVPCGISRAALEQLGPSRCFRKEDALACFDRARPLIELLAAEKLRARPWQGGRLTLWADDIELPLPPEGAAELQQRSA